jgi:hypothetical protein
MYNVNVCTSDRGFLHGKENIERMIVSKEDPRKCSMNLMKMVEDVEKLTVCLQE